MGGFDEPVQSWEDIPGWFQWRSGQEEAVETFLSRAHQLHLCPFQFLDRAFRLFPHLLLPQVNHQEDAIRNTDYPGHPPIQIRMAYGGQVNQLYLNVAAVHHSRQRHAGSEGVVRHLSRSAAEASDQR